MNLQEYKNQIKLMKKQNDTEHDIYPIIWNLIQEGNNVHGKLSLRSVNERRRSPKGQVFYGLSGIPDFAILDLEFDNNQNKDGSVKNIRQIYGCIEIKKEKHLLSIKGIKEKINTNRNLSKEERQLLGEILWYKKVLYTNGNIWKYYEWESENIQFHQIIDMVEKRIDYEVTEKNRDFIWYGKGKEKLDIDEIEFYEKEFFSLSDNTTEEEWEQFKEKIHKIQWKNQE